MSGNSFSERLQAARHSTLLMCVAASQKPMQSASDLPPPPGLLGADWLGLSLPDDVLGGERASEEPPEEPPPVAKLLGKGSDKGDSTVDPGSAVVGAVGVVVAGTPAGGVKPAEGVDDDDVDDVDGAAGVVEPGDALGVVVVREVVVGAEKLGTARDTGALPADERACANAASGNSNKTAMAARAGGLGVSIAITMALPAAPGPSNARWYFCGIHNLASDGISDCCIPGWGESLIVVETSPPHARGWPERNVPATFALRVSPACAGMVRPPAPLSDALLRFPRMRGDGPQLFRNYTE